MLEVKVVFGQLQLRQVKKIITFVKDEVTLSIADFNIKQFALYPNPVLANANTIQQLSIAKCHATGKLVQ